MNRVVLTFFLSFFAVEVWGSKPYALKLLGRDRVEIPYRQCLNVERRLGQLLYLNVDNVNTKDGKVHPLYVKMVRKIQPGGVLLHTWKTSFDSIKKSSDAVRKASQRPIYIGVDSYSLDIGKHNIYFGLGTTDPQGDRFFTGLKDGKKAKLRDKSFKTRQCLYRKLLINGAVSKALGVNHALGPIIEKSNFAQMDEDSNLIYTDLALKAYTSMGVETTLKHYPYAPEFDLHKVNLDVKVPYSKVINDHLPVFKDNKDRSGFVMTTHTFNSDVDPTAMVTYSPKWISMLRDQVGFDGIVMTDAMLMMRAYQDLKHKRTPMPLLEPLEGRDEKAYYTIRSVLSGHDMVIWEGTAGNSIKSFHNIIEFACKNNKLSKKLRKRIDESYTKIVNLKDKNKEIVNFDAKVDKYDMMHLIQAYHSKSCEFDIVTKQILRKISPNAEFNLRYRGSPDSKRKKSSSSREK